ncbi:ABC transporter ATP-binding protein [Natrarchaeobius chitinivorans]|nr:ABC transporter ATP-binding protein [Natrarchaeobius chitinivorans]
MSIHVTNLSKTFTEDEGEELVVLDDIDVTVGDGEFYTVMGPSGCGKSTLLNILAGTIPMDRGEIEYAGSPISPTDLPVGYVFQEPRLLNWRTVGENVDLVLRERDLSKSQREERIVDVLEMVGLHDERESYPLRLSGGMRQRVGIARALAVDPSILLMDEPFSSLDELTARNLRDDLLDLWKSTEKTIIFVTHDISEAVYLSESVTFLDTRGRIFHQSEIEHDRPREPDDPALLETEAALMKTFFDHMATIQSV